MAEEVSQAVDQEKHSMPTEEEEPQYPSRDSLGRCSTPVILHTMVPTDSHRAATGSSSSSSARDATTPVVPCPHGPEKLVPRAPTTLVETLNEPGTTAHDGERKTDGKHRPFSRERRQTRSVRMAQKESSRYRQSKKLWAVAVGDFHGIYGDELTLKAGEKVEIVSKDVRVSRNIGWWTGRNERGRYGIFPEGCVKILPKDGDGEEEVNIETEYPFIISCSDIDLKEAIGLGGFGRVHRAIYKEQEVAVKVARSTTFDLVKAAQDVITEAQKFAHLAHVNVCALIGVVLVRDVCLVMEYAQGGALSEVLHKKKLALPLEVILDWSHQIASGVNYLHTEVKPSLIHRDLKSSNILLAHPITPSNLYNNTIKITDFGLARQIEHTTQMTGAGTYPWMAPEVIISNDFSTKCDVWSYGVVLWELLTGEKPYGNLNAFVVAYGVGRGTLTLPIPAGCPESFQELMNACWHKEHTKRPPFTEVLQRLGNIEQEEFMSSTSFNDFLSIQTTWKTEIHEQFLKFKREESAFKEQELPGDIAKRIRQQEEKIQQQQKELEKLRTDTRQAQEEWQCRREQEQSQAFQRQREELERLKEKLKEMEMRRENSPVAPHQQQQQTRPPRVKRFSARRLLKWLSGTDSQKSSSKIQQQKSTTSSTSSSSTTSSATSTTTHPSTQYSTDRTLQPPRRATSFPFSSSSSSSQEAQRPASVTDDVTTTTAVTAATLRVNKRTSLPFKLREKDVVGKGGGGGRVGGGHKRRHSGGDISKSQIEEYGLGRSTSPTPIPSFAGELGSRIRPFTEEMQKMIERDVSPGVRVRSLSHPRSPSPHLLPLGVSSPNSPKSPQSTSTAHSQSASVASECGSIKKPSNLTLQNKHISSDDSDQTSPMSFPYDSGKDSTTGSDFSNQSAVSNDLQARHLISFHSPGHSNAALQIAMFDPLYQVPADETLQQLPLRQTPSYDSLLQDPNGGTTSGNVSPCIFSTSPNMRRQTSPRTTSREHTSPRSSLSLASWDHYAAAASAGVRNSPIARPRPRPGKLNSYTSDTGSLSSHYQPRPYSPSQHHYPYHQHRRSDVSPSGSVQSLFAVTTDYEYGIGCGFQSDSDATSTHSSLLDVAHDNDFVDDLQPPLVPTPAALEGLYFEFDPQKF